jgi:hypothetical protein
MCAVTSLRPDRPPLEVVTATPVPNRWRFVDDVAVLDLPPVGWQVENMIECSSSVEIFGPPESFKSFFALDLALCVATGTRFYGRQVKPGAVVYVCGEGIGGLPPRVDAWKHAHDINRRAGVHFLTTSVNLLKPGEVAEFIEKVRSLKVDFSLVIFDTLARCMPGGDENGQQDMGLAVQSLDIIREQVPGRPTTAVIHHTPRSGDTSRGSNSLDGAMETQILLKREGDLLSVTCEKQKNGEHFAPLILRRELVQQSLVLITATQLGGTGALISDDSRHRALKSLHETALDDGLTTSTWLKVSGLKDRTFYEARKFLVANDYVIAGSKRGDKNRMTRQGIETITANCNVTAR